jgi:hypothetical protein
MAFEISISGGVQVSLSYNLEIYASTQQALATLEQALSSGQLNLLPTFTIDPESVQAGSSNATILGGGHTDTAAGGHNFTTVAVGADNSTVSGALPSVFQFNASQPGGTHVITDFTHGNDKLQLIGYDTTAAFKQAQVVGGNTVISLDGGKTEIVLNGFNNLHKADFIK